MMDFTTFSSMPLHLFLALKTGIIPSLKKKKRTDLKKPKTQDSSRNLIYIDTN